MVLQQNMYSTTNPLTRRGLTVPMGPKMKEMKRLGKIAIWSLCFATLTLSCTKVEQAESAQAQISYNVVQYTQTKAAGLYPKTEKFISTAFYLEDGKTWAANHSEAIAYIENATISFNGTLWRDESRSYYWPRAGKLTFFSYSPQAIKDYTQIDRNSGITITDWDVNSHKDVDIMIADVQTDQTANQNVGTYTGVPTIFRHKLSQIVGFEFNTFEDYAHGHDGSTSKPYQNEDFVFIVKEISIGNLIQKGSYYSSFDVGTAAAKIGAWIPDGSAAAKSYTWYKNDDGTEIIYSTTSMTPIDGKALMILPQTFANPGEADPSTVPHLKLVYTQRSYNASSYSDTEKTTYVSLYDLFQSSANKINLNRQIKVRITFNLQANLITWAPDQDDWSDSEFSVII